jgi:3-oxoadipate enol-lactonase
MALADLGDVQLNYEIDGDPSGAPVVFAHALGTNLAIWEEVVAALPAGLRLIRYDLRGHGQSSVPEGAYSMGQMVRDAERLMAFLEVKDACFIGISLGGMIAQGLAVKRLDLVRALVLSNTSAKIATPEIWKRRMALVEAKGISAISTETLARWFPRAFRTSPEALRWKEVLEGTSLTGYLGACAAIAGTDFYTPTAGLSLPTLGIGGWDDGSTPPDLVRETVNLIPGSQFALLRKTGHLPCIDQPQAYADLLAVFLRDTGHLV